VLFVILDTPRRNAICTELSTCTRGLFAHASAPGDSGIVCSLVALGRVMHAEAGGQLTLLQLRKIRTVTQNNFTFPINSNVSISKRAWGGISGVGGEEGGGRTG
jgi:hypothetical protein